MRKGRSSRSCRVLLILLLTGERTALNFLQHLSGVATRTAQFVERIKPYEVGAS